MLMDEIFLVFSLQMQHSPFWLHSYAYVTLRVFF